MFVTSDSGLQFDVIFRGKEEFGVEYNEIHGKVWILADSDKDIIFDVNCFKSEHIAYQPELLLELYIDGVLRNVMKLRTGRGLAENQIAEAMIDRGIVLTKDGIPLWKRFRFVDLDLDDAVLTSRVVKEAGTIEVRIIRAGHSFNEEDDIAFQLPNVLNDRGTVSMYCGELNNTVGVRFDDGDDSIRDTREIRLEHSLEMMVLRQNQMLGETLAIFSFQYASDAILLHLGVIPPDHMKYNKDMASERLEVRTRYDGKLTEVLLKRAVSDSDYTLCAKIGVPNLLTDTLSKENVPANSARVVLPIRRRYATSPDCVAKKRAKTLCVTPKKKTGSIYAPLTPPITPQEERTVVYDMT